MLSPLCSLPCYRERSTYLDRAGPMPTLIRAAESAARGGPSTPDRYRGRGTRVPRPLRVWRAGYCLVRRGAVGSLQLLHILRREFRRFKNDGHLVDLAGEVERHLVVAVIHRVGAAETNAERNVEGLNQRK